MMDVRASGPATFSKSLSFPFSACFYTRTDDPCPTPYVGMVDLSQHLTSEKHKGMHAVPLAGIIQVVIYNPERTGIKLFAVKYDLNDMPANTHTILRQRTIAVSQPHSPSAPSTPVPARDLAPSDTIPSTATVSPPRRSSNTKSLRYLIQLRFLCPKKGRVFLYKRIHVVFAHRTPDENEKLETSTDFPADPRYIPCSSDPDPAQSKSRTRPGF
jgi:hypothetical protein